MSGKAVMIADHYFDSQDKLFIDTNIWIYIHGLNGPKNPLAKIYSQALKKMIDSKSKIYIDILIISEFINYYAQTKCRLAGKTKEEFKNFAIALTSS